MKIDLHMHSKHSVDGEHSPTELIKMAKANDLALVSLTDHDTIIGYSEFKQAGLAYGVKTIPGIEISSQIDESSTHILGLNINPESKRFDYLLENFESKERATTAKLIEMFQEELNLQVPFEEMMDRCRHSIFSLVPLVEELTANPYYQRFDLVKPYLPGGNRSDLPIVNFYWDHCQKGGRFYIYMDIPTYDEIIDEIHKDGGLAILAHPFNTFYQQNEYLQMMLDAGLDGIEAYSNYHSPEQNLWYRNYALEKGLLISGGSDYHGAFKPQISIGEFGCDDQDEIFKALIKELG